MTATLEVLNGPNPGVESETLRRWCSAWGKELDAEVRLVECSSESELLEALPTRGEAVGVVVNPGSAETGAVTAAAQAAGVSLAWVDVGEAERPRPPYYEDPAVIAVRGRGIHGYRWALLWLLQRAASPCKIIAYGPQRDQFGDLRLPDRTNGRVPVAVFIHGGFWRERWERDTIEPLAIDLAGGGYATWNLEYRRAGPFGGGWPATFADVSSGIDHLAELAAEHPLDLERVVLVGHSAGGHLALWAVSRRGVDGAAKVKPALVVSLAGIGDLVECARRGLGDTGNAAEALMGGPAAANPEVYGLASPHTALPLGVPQLIVQGDRDNTPDLVDMNATYFRMAEDAGDRVEHLLRPEADHFDLINPGSAAWQETVLRIGAELREAPAED